MAGIKINGDTSGSTTITAPATGSDESIELSTALAGKLDTPGAWTSYTPTVTATSGTITSYTASGAYSQIGKTVLFRFEVLITNQGTAGSAAMVITLPVTAVSAYAGIGTARETDNTGTLQQLYNTSGTAITMNTYSNGGVIATNHRFRGMFTYEAA